MSKKPRVAIMQPYFMPYLGYWQLMSYADIFVVYDQIQFTKKGWIHRNRILNSGKEQMLTLPIKKDSDYKDVCERNLADSWQEERIKLTRRVEQSYKKAPYYDEGIQLFYDCLNNSDENLFGFIFNSIMKVKAALGIESELKTSSKILPKAPGVNGEKRVLSLCKELNAREYINPIGGKELYSSSTFRDEGISLKFHQIADIKYTQGKNSFVPNLSILDVLMFNGLSGTKGLLPRFGLND